MSPRSDFTVRLICLLLLFTSVLMLASDVEQLSAGTRKIVYKVPPVYPALARNTHTSGAVKLNVRVDGGGAPKAIEVIGGNPVLVRAAQDSVNKWKWAPASAETTERVELRFQAD